MLGLKLILLVIYFKFGFSGKEETQRQVCVTYLSPNSWDQLHRPVWYWSEWLHVCHRYDWINVTHKDVWFQFILCAEPQWTFFWSWLITGHVIDENINPVFNPVFLLVHRLFYNKKTKHQYCVTWGHKLREKVTKREKNEVKSNSER